jgi:hypothetical protein
MVLGGVYAPSQPVGGKWVPVFTSKEDLVDWLGGKPHGIASCIAMRASLRAAGSGLTGVRGFGRTATAQFKVLRTFRGLAVAWAIAAFPAHRKALLAATSLSSSDRPDIQRATEYALASAGGGDTEAVIFAEKSIDDLIEAIAVRGKEPFEDFLRACSTDAEILERGTSPAVLALVELWPEAVPPRWFLEDVEDLKMTLLALGEGWDVWTEWYEDRLKGNTPNQSLEAARLTIPGDLWESPRRANEYIRQLVEDPQIFSSVLSESALALQIFGLSHSEAVVVGLRASLRAIPLFSREDVAEPNMLAALRVMSSAWVAARFPNSAPHRVRSQAALTSFSGTRHPLARAASGANSYSATDGQSRATAELVTQAIGELRSYAANLDGYAAGEVFGMSVSDDMNDLRDAASVQVAQLPLWSGGSPPAWTLQRWDELKRKLISLGIGWEVWVDWYENRIAGNTRSEEQEFAYANVPDDLWADGPARVNTWILRKIEQLQSGTSSVDIQPADEDFPTVPVQRPAAIEPIWSNGRLTVSRTVVKTDLKGRAFTAALRSLREELQTFADDIAHQVNIDKRFVAVVQRLSDRIPRRGPVQSEIFSLGHAETIFAAYANTVDAEWPPVLAAQYHALALHFDRTMRQVPLWREFKRNAAKGALSSSQIRETALLATEIAAALRFEEATNFVDGIIPRSVEQMAESLGAALTANSENANTAIDAGAELLAYDVVESVNNILKSIFQVAIWTGIPTTLSKAGANSVRRPIKV